MRKNRTVRSDILHKMLSLIRKQPGIRPRDLHELLHLEHSAGLRNTLIKRGLIRKVKKGVAVYYYPL